MSVRTTSLSLLTAVLVGGGLVACSTPPPEPDEAVRLLATGLETGDLGAVPLSGTTAAAATEALTTAVAALDPRRPTVEVDEVVVSEEGDTATATLTQTWDLDAGETDWTYPTPVDLTLVQPDDDPDDAVQDEPQWQVAWTPALVAPDLTDTEVLAVERVRAERAPVLGADGAVLVEPRDVLRLGIDKTWVEPAQQAASATRVAELLDLDAAAFVERVEQAGEKAFVEALVVRAAEPGVDLDAFAAVTGARSVEDSLPLAPSRRFARAVLGTAGPATAEAVEASEGAVAAGDIAGLSGLQAQYDEQLRGRPGLRVVATAGEDAERELVSLEPVAGTPLQTTLDPEVQEAAETVLEDVEPASAVVAVRPSDGAVLAAASGPGSDGLSTATLGTFAPGSVFKVVSSLALLRSGLTPESEVDCPTSATVDGREFENFPGYPSSETGTITLRTAVAHSCNTAFIGARDKAEPEALAAAAASLGLGGEPVAATLGFPAFLGAVPTDSTGTDHAASMIGQARVQASPLAMATVAASVAAGRTVVPHLVGAEAPAAPAPAEPLTEDEAASLRELMRAVVTEGGATFLADEGDGVLAKTGTAQTGSGDDLHNHAWMIAVRGDLAVAVFVEDGDYGSTTAGPLLEEFLSAVD